MKVVINACYGGFSLSDEAVEWLRAAGQADMLSAMHEPEPDFLPGYTEIGRTDPLLAQCVEELGQKASGMCAKLKVVEVPDEVEWHISEYDGYEHVAENHRTWC